MLCVITEFHTAGKADVNANRGENFGTNRQTAEFKAGGPEMGDDSALIRFHLLERRETKQLRINAA